MKNNIFEFAKEFADELVGEFITLEMRLQEMVKKTHGVVIENYTSSDAMFWMCFVKEMLNCKIQILEEKGMMPDWLLDQLKRYEKELLDTMNSVEGGDING